MSAVRPVKTLALRNAKVENRWAMAPKPRRNRRGRARGRPAPPRLEYDLRRHQLAREVIPQLVERIERFLDFFPRIAHRRVADRIFFLADLASDVLAWTALGAPRDESQLHVRCFAASCLLDDDPHRISWETLAATGIGAEVTTYVRALASKAGELPSTQPDPELAREEADFVVDELRAFTERLRAHQAASGDGLRVSKQLLSSAIALDPVLAEDGVAGTLTAIGAFGLLERTLPTDDLGDRLRLAAILEDLARVIPSLVEHAASHLEDDEDELEDDEAMAALDDEELEEDNGGDSFSLDDVLAPLDARLRLTEEASDGADVAFLVAGALLIQGVHVLGQVQSTFAARVRAIAAADALLSTAGRESSTGPVEVADDGAAVQTAYSQAAALLEADVPEQPPAPEPAELVLSRLDRLVAAMQDVAGEQLVDEMAGALALIGGAAQTLRAGVILGHQDPDKQRRMAAALGALDPLALADLPEVRAAGARTLRELARS